MDRSKYNDFELEILDKLKNWKQTVKQYQKKDVKKAVIQIINSMGSYLGIWFLAYITWDYSILLSFVFIALNSLFLVRIFIIQHDCGHQSFLAQRKWNDLIGWICSLFSTIPFHYWAKSHHYHHGHTGLLEHRDVGDIDFLTVKEFKARDSWGRLKYRIFRLPITTFIIAPLYYLIYSMRIGWLSIPGWDFNVRLKQILNNVLIFGLYALLGSLLGWQRFLIIQLSIVAIFSFIAFWFFYIQHQHEYGYQRWKNSWDFLLASIRGSSYYKLPKFMQFFSGNIGFHHVHHLDSLIPNYNLEAFVKENPIYQKYVNILTFKESFRCMAMKLWDEERNKMISFKEFYLLEAKGLI